MGTIGAGEYTVTQGDCIISIAFESGHFWETIWNHPENADLRNARQDPSVLLAGDSVIVPALRIKHAAAATDRRHRFVRRGVPARLRLRLMQESDVEQAPVESSPPSPAYENRDVITEDPIIDVPPKISEPMANAPYTVTIDGLTKQGVSDGAGYIDIAIPPNAKSGKIVIHPGTLHQSEMNLMLGRLDPISEIAGVKQRLANLSFECGDRTDEQTDGLRDAVSAFQEKSGMTINGELTDEVRQRILKAHGS